MKKIIIFCEGITDQIFISDCLEIFYGLICVREPIKYNAKNGAKLNISVGNDVSIVDIGGCNNLSDPIYASILEDNDELGGINLVVFDADYEDIKNGNKGFKNCQLKLRNIIKEKKINFSFHIWPNHEIDGQIEDLLLQLIPQPRLSILECIESHQECLKSLNIENLRYSELKEKIGFYLYTCSEASEPRNRNYKNNSLWNMDINSIRDLMKFKDFLDPHFKK